MSRKKLKITIECEGMNTQVIEANGMAAAILKDGEDSDHYGLNCVICGNMNKGELIYLYDSVTNELAEACVNNITDRLTPMDMKNMLSLILEGNKNESER